MRFRVLDFNYSVFFVNKWFGVFIIILPILIFTHCTKKVETITDPNTWYTCSMDPQVMEKKPGKCPICKMDLTKITIKKGESKTIHLSEGQEKLANIQTQMAHKGLMSNQMTLNGVITFNENLIYQVSARSAGRIEKLFVKTVGARVNPTQPIYSLYSQLILASWQELMNGNTSELPISVGIDKEKVLTTIKNRLKYMGVSEEVIHKMETNRMSGTEIPFYPTKAGIVMQVFAKEGDYITAGQSLFEIVDLSQLWVEANLYSSDSKQMIKGKKILVYVDGIAKPITGKVESIKPELKENTRITVMRIVISNPNNQLKPGMKAQVVISEGNEVNIKLPNEAVIRTKNEVFVWIKTKAHSFEQRQVKLALNEVDFIGIESGIEPEDEIVVSGAYLLQSEFTFRNKN